jgi:putative tryptophan/tyrosine transport system substrate-binding protein
MSDIRRRESLALLGGAAVAWPLAALAQQSERIRHIGVLTIYPERAPEGRAGIAAFREGLQALGWAEGRNLQIDYRCGALDMQLIERFAKELVALQPDLILSSSTPTTASLLQQTRTIPVIFANIVDPVGSGFVASLARPAGNVTGFLNLEPAMAGKWVQLLKEIAPRVARVAIPFNPDTAPYAEIYLSRFKAAAASFGMEVAAAPTRNMAGLDAFVASQAREPNIGFIPVPDGFMNARHAEIVALTARYRIPAVHFSRAFAEAGGLLSYGNNIPDNYRRAATYADRILKGEKPGELPVQFPVKFELVINLKAAKALGLDVPLQLQQLADEVIE